MIVTCLDNISIWIEIGRFVVNKNLIGLKKQMKFVLNQLEWIEILLSGFVYKCK